MAFPWKAAAASAPLPKPRDPLCGASARAQASRSLPPAAVYLMARRGQDLPSGGTGDQLFPNGRHAKAQHVPRRSRGARRGPAPQAPAEDVLPGACGWSAMPGCWTTCKKDTWRQDNGTAPNLFPKGVLSLALIRPVTLGIVLPRSFRPSPSSRDWGRAGGILSI